MAGRARRRPPATGRRGGGGSGAYEQDRAVLEAQQRAIGRHARQPFHTLNIDAGAACARRLIDHMIAAEGGAAPLGPS